VLPERQAAIGARTRNARTVDANSPVVFAVETRDDPEQRALAAPARPDERQRLPASTTRSSSRSAATALPRLDTNASRTFSMVSMSVNRARSGNARAARIARDLARLTLPLLSEQHWLPRELLLQQQRANTGNKQPGPGA